MYVEEALDNLVKLALVQKISDIHFDAIENGIHVRFRRDGLLETNQHIAEIYGEQIINRIKVLSGLDISEKRLPQDGRWQWERYDLAVTMRVSSIPTILGETIVCRLMGNEGSYKSLLDLGMPRPIFEEVQQLLNRPYGLILISGPTGSGKTATLYAMLRMLQRDRTKLICLEDPVEAMIEGAIQIGVNERIGLTFSHGLRSILRQDPDSIMIGEIRDNETARLAVQAALTGHRVLSTIHTNGALGVIERLQDMGVEPYLIRDILIGALAQRLIRKYDDLSNTYCGRTAIYELLSIPRANPNWSDPKSFIIEDLETAAQKAVAEKITTVEEIHRIGLGF